MAGLGMVALLFPYISMIGPACEPPDVLTYLNFNVSDAEALDEHETLLVQWLMNTSPNESTRISLTHELENTYWKLVELGDQRAIANAVSGEIHIRLFPQDRMVQGFAGCNQLRGRYDLEGKDIRFGGLATTRKVCAGRMEQEHAFLKALQMTARWNIEGEHLEFTTAEQKLLARFEAQSSK